MATFYSLTVTPLKGDGTWGKIEFSSPSKELFGLVESMVHAATDATSWRNRVEEVHIVNVPDFEDEQ